jgi:voltage-gated potassium channel Kch
MLVQVLIGSALILVTTLIHAGGMSVALRWLTMTYAKRLHLASFWKRSLVVAALVLILFVATFLEASLWAATYVVLDAISEFEEALYFSIVTYTTLGYGDVVLDDRWRLLSSVEAANGLIIFAWTTALIIVALRRFSKQLPKLRALD